MRGGFTFLLITMSQLAIVAGVFLLAAYPVPFVIATLVCFFAFVFWLGYDNE